MNFADMSEKGHPIKEALLAAAQQSLKDQIADIQNQLEALQESSESEEKSSAGDKYETHQEMLNQSRDMLEKSLAKSKMLLAQLNAVPVKELYTVQEGALVKLSIGNLWVSIPLGKISLQGTDYQLVSNDSPLVSTLWGLKKGDSYEFRGKKENIFQID
ncbi:P24 capsid protein [Cecembia calidifontis]|jgi:transcription elongation GreA/GreB family factor|uniref:P24 capsid protein n=2 Tax=Cecembia calidifontis TaxID=1187080 RepID=A0A4V2F6V8_9BACT|nr:P24 capsid protein [Cecembia calidifontis]